MYKLKTKASDNSVIDFIEKIENAQKKADAYLLLEIFSETSKYEAKMWGDSMIGFGSYHYKYASGHEGDAFLVGFSPRKAKISLYLDLWEPESEVLTRLGKYTNGKACVYINKLSDIDVEILKQLIAISVESLTKRYPN